MVVHNLAYASSIAFDELLKGRVVLVSLDSVFGDDVVS